MGTDFVSKTMKARDLIEAIALPGYNDQQRDHEFAFRDEFKSAVNMMAASAIAVEVNAIELDTVRQRPSLRVNPKYHPKQKLEQALSAFENSLKVVLGAMDLQLPSPRDDHFLYDYGDFKWITDDLRSIFMKAAEERDDDSMIAAIRGRLPTISDTIGALKRKLRDS